MLSAVEKNQSEQAGSESRLGSDHLLEAAVEAEYAVFTANKVLHPEIFHHNY